MRQTTVHNSDPSRAVWDQAHYAPLEHRTVRHFKDEPVPETTVAALLAVAQRTASSLNMQTRSLIRVVSAEQRALLAEVTGQPYVGTAPEVWLFLADARRNADIVARQGADGRAAAGLDRFFQGYADACLCVQNVYTALESMGLGGVIVGSIYSNLQALIRGFALPPLTFPVLALAFGAVDRAPDLKPRLPQSLTVFRDRYAMPADAPAQLAAYDAELADYVDLRQPDQTVGPFSAMLNRMLGDILPPVSDFLAVVRQQGFDVDGAAARKIDDSEADR